MKRMKRIPVLMLVFVLSVCVFTNTGLEVKAATTTKVYFDNSVAKWSDVYAYVWNNSSDAKVFEATKKEKNIYSFDIKGSYSKILFKNTAGKNSWDLQTKDLSIPTTAKNCYKPSGKGNKPSGSWYAYEPLVTPSPTPTVTPKPTVTPEPAINPVITADKSTAKVGETITFTCSASYEDGNYKNGRMLYITDPSGKEETITGWDSNTSYSTFEKVGTFKYTHTYVVSQAGIYTFQYG